MKFHLPDTIIMNIFTYCYQSYDFFKLANILNFSSEAICRTLFCEYFEEIPGGYVKEDQTLIKKYVSLDFFLFHKHLLILDDDTEFKKYFRSNDWSSKICQTHPDDFILYSSLKNIIRISYFVDDLRVIEQHQRQITKDKILQTNISRSFKLFIDTMNTKSENEKDMIMSYINKTYM